MNDIDKKYINCIIKIDKSNNKENQIFIYHSRIDKEYYIEMSNKCKNTMLIHLLFTNKDNKEIIMEKIEKRTYYDDESLSIADIKHLNTKL